MGALSSSVSSAALLVRMNVMVETEFSLTVWSVSPTRTANGKHIYGRSQSSILVPRRTLSSTICIRNTNPTLARQAKSMIL
ncbi:hypothetical protein PC116_g9068 [Phytophthora cactorum]|uniref:Uncharacterized protein n=1 Tax=Phytophthora cactorum TaxID=29920 RepID=A0A8T1L673_9STRA|nr:hypothetical protein PC111_g5780 [Phytophthora cactorum]KAG2861693.1 hypothetical protein PC113_g6956 [Phytophthora cactorum]KAG2917969.1 hypothetical protein PC114_g6947 [Phytophthora cactorum]KAG2932229.1 hypothetical protein PC115_g5861 [Phytophthora cactorum]KAG3016608.1 hypothetical protein PC119_g11311 [Phytophthora cactorum]